MGFAGGWLASRATGPGGARPAAKEVIKAGLNVFERGRQAAAEWSEWMSDLVAETTSEREQERSETFAPLTKQESSEEPSSKLGDPVGAAPSPMGRGEPQVEAAAHDGRKAHA
jgi:hypothetical protein